MSNEQSATPAAPAAGTVVVQAGEKLITLKRPEILAQYRLVETLGQSAENRVYLTMCIPLIYVVAIDDERVAQPRTKLEVEALIQRLGEEGIKVVSNAVDNQFGADVEVAAAKK